ncbi:DUF2158 domain-containing protein [Salegentibacter sp. UBA1130]|uniref:DUF2158 domain-containing protein n=1 Tax=Salegentibacter sp. UBA1130 TaxID=1947451 RepID=UPI0039C8D751
MSSKEDFKIGQSVILNSGGPAMTIVEVYEDFCKCGWFDVNSHFQISEFNKSIITGYN